ncbi:alpha/beta hydrolase fold domain-containing protein [Flagellimonas sp. CMM7]|uniref:alpha/beta hydrolase fold domain-containing protein n=1 Tax=Flagellimonas sp. CMM7 TaxID=2654676 RepID=UPI0013D325DA|nr:alpha/beta hydrolase fold domain-containing protein [Flagellimonas sp. CMM7]UII78775.1 alpha/beta hydrolase [Flagellimonas sp. CMM7]
MKMDSKMLHPEIRKVVLRTPRIPWHRKLLLPISKVMYNIGARTELGKGVVVSTEIINGVEIQIFSPEQLKPKGAVLWIFGGGHLAGKPEHLNGIATKVVNELCMEVIAPKYRLSPENPFPADLDDCFEAWNWLVGNSIRRGYNDNKLAIAGNSAGGGIAAALAQRILDSGGVQPQAQCLFYPMLDDRTAIDHSLDRINHFLWNNKANFMAWDAYLGNHHPGDVNIPKYAAAARRNSLKGLPPTWIGHCELDLFANEYATYAERLRNEGVVCQSYYVKGVPHAFELFIPKSEMAEKFESSALTFLKEYMK